MIEGGMNWPDVLAVFGPGVVVVFGFFGWCVWLQRRVAQKNLEKQWKSHH